MVGQVTAAGAALASASALPAAVFGPSGAEVLGSRNHAGPIPGALPGDILERVALGHQQRRYNPTEHANSQELHWPRSMGKCQWAAAQREVFQNSKQESPRHHMLRQVHAPTHHEDSSGDLRVDPKKEKSCCP